MSSPAIDLNQNPVDVKTTTGFNRFDNRSRKNLRTIGHRFLTVTALLCILVLVLYIIFHQHEGNPIIRSSSSHQVDQLRDDKPLGVCLTQGCIEAASIIIKNLDTSVDPCDDFYQFACGGWINETILPHGKLRIGTLNKIQEIVYNKLRVDLNNLASSPLPRNSYEFKLVSTYKTCLNVDNAAAHNGNQPLINIINGFGGWLNQRRGYRIPYNVAEVLIKLKDLGVNFNFLVAIDIGPDLKNTSNNIIAIDQAELVLKHKILYTEDAYLRSYTRLITTAAARLGIDVIYQVPAIEGIVKFEKLLAQGLTPAEARRDYSNVYRKMTIRELKSFSPNIDWHRLLVGTVKYPLELDEQIVIFDLQYILYLDKFVSEMDPNAFHDYFIWRIIYDLMPYLSKEWRDDYNIFHESVRSEKPRWEECLDFMMDQGMDVALSSLYVKNHCDPETKQMATMAFQYIKNEFVGILEQIDWMGEKTKQMALKKVKAMDAYIAYPEQILNHSLINQFYENFNLGGDFPQVILNLKRWNKHRDFSQYGKKTHEIWWKQSQPAIVNAFYNPLENKIQLPAALLQGIFFEKDRPYYLNFASFGFLIGHEITHGFDERGKQFDEAGNLQNWWDDETNSRFNEKIECMIEQYSNYSVVELNMNINGELSKGENMADNGGLKLALKAYESWAKAHSQEPPLPGLAFTPDKLFWIGAANFWCEKQTILALRNQLLRDEHSPGRFRVIGPMSNIPEFAASFNCPLGTKMNPTSKCSVW